MSTDTLETAEKYNSKKHNSAGINMSKYKVLRT